MALYPYPTRLIVIWDVLKLESFYASRQQTGINSNMGCIETAMGLNAAQMRNEINSNIGYIETSLLYHRQS